MKKDIRPQLLLAVAALLAAEGCSSNAYTRYCVDERGNRVPDSECTTSRTGVGFVPVRRWAYSRSGGVGVGRSVPTPSYNAPDAEVRSSSGTHISGPRRGGFGGGIGFGG